MNITSSYKKTILTTSLLLSWSNVNLFWAYFSIFWLQAVSCQATPAWLGERGFQISLMISWINRFDLISQPNVLENADRVPSRRQCLWAWSDPKSNQKNQKTHITFFKFASSERPKITTTMAALWPLVVSTEVKKTRQPSRFFCRVLSWVFFLKF